MASYRRDRPMKYKFAVIAESLRDDPRNDVEAGTQTIHFGFDPDPDYDVLTDDGVKRITHETVERIEAPHRMSKSEFKQYIRDEVLPLEKEQEAEA